MNHKLAQTAIEAIEGNDPEYPTAKSNCQAFVRECIETAHGESVSEKIRAGSAKLSVPLWRKLGWGFPAVDLDKHGGLQEGDCLYKTVGSGGFGHVGIAVKSGEAWRVAENSSTTIGRVRGALGYRTLSQFGAFQWVGRLPESIAGTPQNNSTAVNKRPELVIALKRGADFVYRHIDGAALIKGRFHVSCYELNKKLGLKNDGADYLVMYVPEYLQSRGYKLIQRGDHLKDKVRPVMYLFVERT